MFDKKEYDRRYYKKYKQTEQAKKLRRFRDWRNRGIIFYDFELLYEIYLEATNCDFCKCELNTSNKTTKCLDHDHDIVDDENVRAILCFNCNVKDVYNDNKPLKKNNTSGETNIRYNKRQELWIFEITINKKPFRKYFKKLEDAIQFKKDYLNQIEQ